MFRIGLLSLLLHLSVYALASDLKTSPHFEGHPAYPFLVSDSEAYEFSNEYYTLIGHGDAEFDDINVSKDGIQRVVKLSQKRGIETITFIGSGNLQHIAPEDSDYNIASYAGQHSLTFPKAKKLILTGGYLHLCLCEVLRDTIKGTTKTDKSPIEILMVTDGIYEQLPDQIMWSYPDDGQPYFDHTDAFDNTSQEVVTLEDYIQEDKKVPGMLRALFNFGVMGSTGYSICGHQNWFKSKEVDKNKYTLKVLNEQAGECQQKSHTTGS